MAAIRTQVVFDAAQPHAQAAFWAEALHYEHEEIDAFVSGLVSAGRAFSRVDAVSHDAPTYGRLVVVVTAVPVT